MNSIENNKPYYRYSLEYDRLARKLAYLGAGLMANPPIDIVKVAHSVGVAYYYESPLGKRWSIAYTIALQECKEHPKEFAANLLIPLPMLERVVVSGISKISELAKIFNVPQEIIQLQANVLLGQPVEWNEDIITKG